MGLIQCGRVHGQRYVDTYHEERSEDLASHAHTLSARAEEKGFVHWRPRSLNMSSRQANAPCSRFKRFVPRYAVTVALGWKLVSYLC